MVAGNKYKRSHKHIKMERLQIAFFIRVCKCQNGIEVMCKHWIVRVVTVSQNMDFISSMYSLQNWSKMASASVSGTFSLKYFVNEFPMKFYDGIIDSGE